MGVEDYKFEIGDKAWYRWGDWEIVVIERRRVREDGRRVYVIDLLGREVEEGFLYGN